MKDFRRETGMTQSQFATYFEIPLRTVQEWEQKRKVPPDYILKMMKRIWKHENTSQ